jgi:hypothetical protein
VARGRKRLDARLVAAIRVHGVKPILPFNDRDFARYSEPCTLAAFLISNRDASAPRFLDSDPRKGKAYAAPAESVWYDPFFSARS